MQQKKSENLATKLSKFINVPRTLKVLMATLTSNELTEEEREDIVIICSFLIDEHLQDKE